MMKPLVALGVTAAVAASTVFSAAPTASAQAPSTPSVATTPRTILESQKLPRPSVSGSNVSQVSHSYRQNGRAVSDTTVRPGHVAVTTRAQHTTSDRVWVEPVYETLPGYWYDKAFGSPSCTVYGTPYTESWALSYYSDRTAAWGPLVQARYDMYTVYPLVCDIDGEREVTEFRTFGYAKPYSDRAVSGPIVPASVLRSQRPPYEGQNWQTWTDTHKTWWASDNGGARWVKGTHPAISLHEHSRPHILKNAGTVQEHVHVGGTYRFHGHSVYVKTWVPEETRLVRAGYWKNVPRTHTVSRTQNVQVLAVMDRREFRQVKMGTKRGQVKAIVGYGGEVTNVRKVAGKTIRVVKFRTPTDGVAYVTFVGKKVTAKDWGW